MPPRRASDGWYERTLDLFELRASIAPQMRTSNRGARVSTTAAALALVVALAACGGSTGTPPPSSAGPIVTPDPHLAEPVSVDALYRMLGAAGIHITPNTASTGPNGEPVKRIVGTYRDWPLVLTQYTTHQALKTQAKFDAKVPPGRGEAPYIVEGLNILIEFGPRITNDRSPAPPPDDKRDAMIALVGVLNPLLGPLGQRTVVPLPIAGAAQAETEAPSASPKS
jgi:hypothetical protein